LYPSSPRKKKIKKHKERLPQQITEDLTDWWRRGGTPILSYFCGLSIFRESGNRRFSPKRQEGRVGLSEDLLEVSGDSLGFADEGGGDSEICVT
jgi:hypothetical protein